MLTVEQDRVVSDIANICTVGDLRRALDGLVESTPISCAAGEPLLVSIVTPIDLTQGVFVEVS